MTLELCPYCGGEAAQGTTCPRALECPHCGAGAGAPCRRPSGHRAEFLHAARVELAELADHRAGLELERGDTDTDQLTIGG